jgi:hypothetical protein
MAQPFTTQKNRQLLFDVAMRRFPERISSDMFGRFFRDFCDSEPLQDYAGAIPLIDMNKRFINQLVTHINTHTNQTGLSAPVDFSRQAMGLDLPYQNPGKHPGLEDAAARRITDFAKSMTPTMPERPRQLEAIKPPVAMDPEEFHLELKRRTQAQAQDHITLTIGQPDSAAEIAIQRTAVDLDEDMMSFVQNLLDSDEPVHATEIRVLHDAMEMRMERIERTLAAIYAAVVNGPQLGSTQPQTASQLAAGQVRFSLEG